MDVKIFYSKLNEALNNSKLSQTEIADILKVSRNTISNWKNGSTSPSAIQIPVIAELCDKSINWFYDIEQNEGVEYLKEKIALLEENVKTQTQLIKKLEVMLDINKKN